MKFIQGLNKVAKGISKNSPLILTVTGVVGIGATAVLAYKSRGRVEEIIEGVEGVRKDEERIAELQEITYRNLELTDEEQTELAFLEENYVPVSKATVIRDIAGAVALPVATGVASLACVTLSWYIMNNRLLTVSGALATATAEHVYYKRKVADRFGEEIERELSTPVHKVEAEYKDEKGKSKTGEVNVKDTVESLEGRWFDESMEYTADDFSYNKAFVESVAEKLSVQFMNRGSLTLNQVYDALGFPRSRAGALMGWSGAGFAIDTQVVHTLDKTTGFLEPQLYVKWPRPHYIYDTMELDVPITGII